MTEKTIRTTEGFSRQLSEQLAGWSFEQVPLEVCTTLKYMLLDVLGVMAGGKTADGVADLNRRMAGWETGSATILVTGDLVSPPSAAMANSTAAHALDFDDQHDPARVHTASVLVPALLATAEGSSPVSGRDFLLAMAIGAEVNARLGLASPRCLARGWHPTMVFGVLSTSLACGRLLGLDSVGLNHALGLAYHQAGGSAQAARDGSLAKRLGAGFAARSAVLSAFLAADGITGAHRSLEGSAGFFSLYERDDISVETISQGLGSIWHTRDYSFKPYPCCRCNHTAIDLAIVLHDRGIKSDEVDRVEIFISELNHVTVGEVYQPERNSVVHAQFNVAYGFAAALCDGEVGLRHYQPGAITDPRYHAITSRTTVLIDPNIDANALSPARVRLHMLVGGYIEVSSEQMRGSPEKPMTGEELANKFRMCVTEGMGVRSSDAASALIALVLQLERSEDVALSLVKGFRAMATDSHRP
jgi:2-methylcitrate dehydratase PrpD